MKSTIRWKAASLGAIVAVIGFHVGVASAQSTYKIGISGAATCPASPSYLPHIEGLRIYLSQLNDKGGVNGRKNFILLDDKVAPSEAANNAKRSMDDDQVLAVALMSLSSTYAPMFQAAQRTKTPLLLLGQAVCPANASTPQMKPYVFCGGSTSDPNTAGYWQIPLVKALADKNKDKLKLALVAMDIPISRQGIDNMEKFAGEMKIEIDRQTVGSAGRRRRQRCSRAHHRQQRQLRDQLGTGDDGCADAGRLATPGMERLVHPQSLR